MSEIALLQWIGFVIIGQTLLLWIQLHQISLTLDKILQKLEAMN